MDKSGHVDEESFINKLILLYIFDQCNVGLIESVILDIATSHNWIQPIFCKPAFDELVKTDYLVNLSRPRAAQPRYKITPDGRECLKCFKRFTTYETVERMPLMRMTVRSYPSSRYS